MRQVYIFHKANSPAEEERIKAGGRSVKGFVPTPDHVVDDMVAKLFSHRPPRPHDVVLDPGCGTGAFIEGVVRWCSKNGSTVPRVIGIESDPAHLPEALSRLDHLDSVSILNEDFLIPRNERVDYVIGNPPYVPITEISRAERTDYRRQYSTATGRFDLYLLFFEQALKLLKPGGRLVFITPEKFAYVRTAAPLRRALTKLTIEEIHFVNEATFGELVTYPTVTTIVNAPNSTETRVILRDGSTKQVRLTSDGSSWLPTILGTTPPRNGYTLADASLRISCGVATGADAVYITKSTQLTPALRQFAFPTVAGRDISLGKELAVSHSMLVPYARSGQLLREDELGALGTFLSQPDRKRRLVERTCIPQKPWYAFHENPPLDDILKPKILCKDITSVPFFLVEGTGEIVPRHSVYYIVPKNPAQVHELCAYLNSSVAQAWLVAHCQRAASGFLRLQSHVLKRVPLPIDLVPTAQLSWSEPELASL